MTASVLDQLAWERRARQLLEGVVAASARGSVDTVLVAALDQVCTATGWPIGHVLRRDGDELASAELWRLDADERFQALRDITATMRFPRGVGLPGRVLESGQPHWVADVLQDDNFPRARAVADLGVTSGFAFPVVASGEVAAVLEFFSPTAFEPDPPFLDVMAALGIMLGRAIERAHAEQELRESEMRFRSVAQTAQDAVIVVDDDGAVVLWNPRATEMFGWTETEILGRSLTEIIPPRHRDGHEQGLHRVRAGGERRVLGRTVTLDGLRRDGSEFPIELSLATFTAHGRAYYTGLIRDISRRRANEQRLEQAEQRAVEASRAKSLFVASMSHELRTPLNTILGFAQLLRRDGRLDAEQRDNLGVILRSGEHLLELINDVLSLSKIEAGAASERAIEFDPDRLVRGLRDMFAARTKLRGVELVFRTSDLPAIVRGDEGKLRQVLINLVSNAVKFCSRGSITVTIAWAAERAAFAVADTGRGIPEAELPLLFEPFRQAHKDASTREGVGLGLAISRDHIRLLGGELAVTSVVGQGTTFSFEIPLAAARGRVPHELDRGRVAGIAPDQPEWRVLVVDDDRDNRRLLARLLALVGFVTREAQNGAEAIAQWAEWHPHFIWMDMRMSGIDGYEATRRIRTAEAASKRPRCAIVALTASAFEHDRPAILEVGCDGVVAKPFDEQTIFDELAHRLGVRYTLESQAPAAPPLAIGELPAALCAQLASALAAGDDAAALVAIGAIEDAALAGELARRVRAFDFDSILTALEGARA
jgi:two-component system sensor histidine kinase/response regulator